MNANRLQIIGGGWGEEGGRKLNVQNGASKPSSRKLLLASHSGYRLVVNFATIGLNKCWHVLNPPFNKETWDTNSH